MARFRWQVAARGLACTTLLYGVVLAGCANPAAPDVTHFVRVGAWTNAFMQQHNMESLSMQVLVDAGGHRWPVGLTLGALAVRSELDGTEYQRLLFRHDTLYPGNDLDAAYQQAKALKQSLPSHCRTVAVQIDGQPEELDIRHINVRVYADRERMPVPVTDQDVDPVEVLVEDNPPDRLVISTRVTVAPDPSQFARLAAARVLRYDLCGHETEARPAELDGLRQVHEWALHPSD